MKFPGYLGAIALGGIGYALALSLARNRISRFEDIDLASADTPGRSVDVAGVRLHLVEQGDGEPVVLIHGMAGSTFSYRFIIPALAESHRVIALDLKGFGYSGRPPKGDYSLTAQADLVLGLMDNLGIARAALVGHSMGGGVAMRLALGTPKRVSSLVLVDSVGGSTEERRTRFGVFARPLLPFVAAFTLGRYRAFERGLRSAVHDPRFVTAEVVEGYQRPFRVKGHLRALEALITSRARDASLAVESISQPTLILWGEHDRWVPLTQGEDLARRIPDARLDVVPEAGHLPLEEQPDYCNKAILAFLGKANAGVLPLTASQAES